MTVSTTAHVLTPLLPCAPHVLVDRTDRFALLHLNIHIVYNISTSVAVVAFRLDNIVVSNYAKQVAVEATTTTPKEQISNNTFKIFFANYLSKPVFQKV